MFKVIALSAALLSTAVSACPGLQDHSVRAGVQFGVSKRQEGVTAATPCGDYDYSQRGLDWAEACPSKRPTLKLYL